MDTTAQKPSVGDVIADPGAMTTLPEGALILGWGTYPNATGTFSACHARILPEAVTGAIADPLDRPIEVLTYGSSTYTTVRLLKAAVILHVHDGPLPRPVRTVKAEALREAADHRHLLAAAICRAASCDDATATQAASAVVEWLDGEASRIEDAEGVTR